MTTCRSPKIGTQAWSRVSGFQGMLNCTIVRGAQRKILVAFLAATCLHLACEGFQDSQGYEEWAPRAAQ